MLKSKSSQKRASSAGSGSQKKHRILSGKSMRKNQRIHTQSYEGFESVKPTKSRLLTTTMDHKFPQSSSKGPQELVQENLHLKVELKELNARLNLTRTKIQFQKKKHLMYSRKLNREFQKQLYWPSDKGQDYLITGIKHQYQKVKQSLDQKCTQLQMVRQTITYSSISELASYCESLQVQNKILIENISYLKKKKRRASSVEENGYTQVDVQQIIAQQRKKDQRNQAKIKTLQQQITKQSLTQKQHIKKIHFLEKLIIQKENESYHMCKKMKTIQRQKSKLINQMKVVQTKMLQRQRQHQQQFEQLRQKAQRQAKVQKAIYQKSVKQKTLLIQKLQKQIAYLSTLLSYWKPLDELDRLDINNSSQKSYNKDNKSISLNLNQSMSLHGTTNRQMVRSRTPLNLNIDQQNLTNDQRILLKTTQKQDAISRRDSSLQTIQREESDKFSKAEGGTNRQPRRSTKKLSLQAKKNRRVQFTQIQHLGQLIRFKLISAQKPLHQVKQYFTCKLPKTTATKYDQELITMKQVTQTLSSPPFSLSPQQSCLLSRYIIEDPVAQHVYTHQLNQLQRPIVKSIIRTIIGEYSLPHLPETQQKWLKLKSIYSHNMQLALKSICPKGTVSKNKFLELMNSLGIEADQETKDYVVARMVKEATSLTALPYESLFDENQTIN